MIRCILSLVLSLALSSFVSDCYGQQDSSLYEVTKDTAEPGISAATYLLLLKDNFTAEIAAPFKQNKQDWLKSGIFVVATAGLIALDKPVQKLATGISEPGSNYYKINSSISDFGGIPLIVSVAALGASGLAFHDDKLKNTALMASQAYITATAFSTTIKYVSGRERPDLNGQSSGRFLGPIHGIKTGEGSFPSRHTAVAFSTATVFATAYRDSPWIPAVSYGIATLIGLSRINTNEHSLSDVFVGAALGFVSGKQVMNRYRLLKNETAGQLKWNAGYSNGHIEIGIRYLAGN